MKRRLLLLAGALAAVLLAAAGFRVVRSLSFFQIRRVEVVGGTYVTPLAMARALNIARGTSIFDPVAPLRTRAGRVPGVLEVRIVRRLPGTIRAVIREAAPVALTQRNGSLALLDARGRVLAFDPTSPAADLPLADADAAVAGLLSRIRDTDSDLFSRIERGSRARDDVLLDLSGGRVLFRADATGEEIRDLALVLGLLQRQDRRWRELDARFSSRVVIRSRGA